MLSYMGYIGRCGPKGYGFSAVLVINRIWFLHSSLELGMFFRRSDSFIIVRKINKSPSRIMFRTIAPVAIIINRVSSFWSGHK